jgi:hypothetical protein
MLRGSDVEDEQLRNLRTDAVRLGCLFGQWIDIITTTRQLYPRTKRSPESRQRTWTSVISSPDGVAALSSGVEGGSRS